jgi:hypothetical protein
LLAYVVEPGVRARRPGRRSEIFVEGAREYIFGRLPVGHDDRGAVVAGAELHADSVLMLRPDEVVLAHVGDFGRRPAGRLSGRPLRLHVLRNYGVVHHRRVLARRTGVATPIGLRSIVGIDQTRSAPALQSAASFHARFGCRRSRCSCRSRRSGEEVRRVAGKKMRPARSARHEPALRPRVMPDDMDRNVFADRLLHPRATSSRSTSV